MQETEQIQEITAPAKKSLDGDYPGLSALSWYIGYLEQALAILSEPLLIGCSALAVIDFTTGGALLAIPFIMYLWAAGIATAVTACFIVTWRRALRAFSQYRYFAGILLALMGCCLGLVDWTAVAAQSLEQALHISLAQAVNDLGFDVFWVTNVRAGVAIAMAVVVAISNHAGVAGAQAPKRRLAAWDNMLNRIAPVVTEPHDALLGIAQEARQTDKEEAESITIDPDTAPLERVRLALVYKPSCSDRELGRLTNLAPATAKKYKVELNH